MTAGAEAIVTLYELNHLTAEEISEAEGMELVMVKQLLAQYSKEFRRELAMKSNAAESTDEREKRSREMEEIIVALASNAENEAVRLSAAKYIHAEDKGRNENESLGDKLLGVAGLNAILRKSREIRRIKGKRRRTREESETIDVEAHSVGELVNA